MIGFFMLIHSIDVDFHDNQNHWCGF